MNSDDSPFSYVGPVARGVACKNCARSRVGRCAWHGMGVSERKEANRIRYQLALDRHRENMALRRRQQA